MYYKLLDWIDITKLQWEYLSGNPNAIHLISEALKQNPEKINWDFLSLNPNAIHLLERNPEKIYWSMLSLNPNAIHLLEQNPDKINWVHLSENPSIFTYDYEKIAKQCEGFKEELTETFYHPDNMKYWVNECNAGFETRWVKK